MNLDNDQGAPSEIKRNEAANRKIEKKGERMEEEKKGKRERVRK